VRVLVLARHIHLPWYGFAYGSALERLGVHLSYLPEDTHPNTTIQALVKQCPERPDLIYLPDWNFSPIPPGLTTIDIPTLNVNEDTYAYTNRRIRWSMLFDYTLLFHPCYEDRFRAAGHPRPIFLPLAVNRDVIEGPEEERTLEVGSVGRTDSDLYVTRLRVLSMLDSHFRMNDWRRRYSPKEMVKIYRMSKIVINIPREDYLQEANMRVFEVMGSGALLLTRLPTELSDMGFQEGVHFVGYRREEELVALIRHFLADDPARLEIARKGHEIVWREHTYESRAASLLDQLRSDAGRLLAPARRWKEEQVALAYLDHYAAHMYLSRAHEEWKTIARRNPLKATVGGSLLARAYARRVQRRLFPREIGF
jgi:Glycosyl transferases group 1